MTASLGFNFFVAGNTVSPEMARIGNDALKMAAKTKAAGLLSGTAMTAFRAGIAGAAAEGVALVDALAPMGGLLAALPAVALAGAVSVGALALGFHGLGAAMKTAGGGAGPSASAIAAAERRVAAAQREATQAQLDLNDAREQAAANLLDIANQLERANLDQVDSALAVKEAEQDLRKARQGGKTDQIVHAQIALQRAQISARESVMSLTKTQDEYNQKQAAGVEGSKEVQAALQKQANATQSIADAQDALKETKSGGSGASAQAEAYAKLAPAAKQLVDAMKSLGPAWRGVAQATQQAELDGVGSDVRQLGAVYLPMLKVQLAGVAKGWNIAFRQTAALAKTSGFVKDTNTGLANTAKFSQLAGQAMAPIVDGIRQFGVVGSQYLPRLGAWIRDIALSFDKWATNARESGKMNVWIDHAVVAAGTLGQILGNLGGAIRGIFHAGDAGPGFLATLERVTATFDRWVNTAEGQARLELFFGSLRDLANKLWGVVQGLSSAFVDSGPTIKTIAGSFSLLGAVIRVLADHMGLVNAVLPPLLVLFVTYKTVTTSIRLAMLGFNAALAIVRVGWMLLNVLFISTPIGWIVLAIAAVVAIFILLYNKTTWFKNAWDTAWAAMVTVIKLAVGFIKDKVLGPLIYILAHPFESIGNAWNNFWHGIGEGLQWAYDHTIKPLLDFIRSNIDDLKRALDFNPFGGGAFHTVDRSVPHMASGGIVSARPGGTLVLLGEGGQDEAVVPLGGSSRGSAGGGGDVHVYFHGNEMVQKMIRKIVYDTGGGNVQKAFGQ